MIRVKLTDLTHQAIEHAQKDKRISKSRPPEITLERPRDPSFGDWSTNAAMVLASDLKRNPLEIAETLASYLRKESRFVSEVTVAKPGFINFRIAPVWLREGLLEIQEQGSRFGHSNIGGGQRVQLEFVSANPTGPLHIGHGRWAAVGDALANVLSAAGFKVEREFYVNDYGTQMDLFGRSVSARYAQILGADEPMPEDGYQGSYVKDIAQDIADRQGDRYLRLAGDERARAFREEACREVLSHLKRSLDDFGVDFDSWFSETGLHASGAVDKVIAELKERGHVYERDGAVWLKTTEFGDDKDRVLIRDTGEPTYFAADVAYHRDKLERGFDKLINIWGADHHGYVGRVKAAVKALGYPDDVLEILLGQLVNLLRRGEPVRMSKRTGELVTFDELVAEVGKDVARYIFLTRSTDSPLDFDIELAKEQSQDNPVYYVQYAHARISSILKFASEQGAKLPVKGAADLSLLVEPAELDLIRKLVELPELVEDCALLRAPWKLTRYAEDLAALFHVFYTKCRVVTEDEPLTKARLTLVQSTQIVLQDVLRLLGVTAPQEM